jgi:two-component system response regulator HydG
VYRLKSVYICLPPLRERRGDIPELATHFLRNACARHARDIKSFSPEAMNILVNKDYPGNIRELSQIVENAVILADNYVILPAHLGEIAGPLSAPYGRKLCTFKENYDQHLSFVLASTKGDRREAARILGVTLRQLQRKLAEMK